MGSIAAGGRYDNMVGQFAGKDIPAVGVSIGTSPLSFVMFNFVFFSLDFIQRVYGSFLSGLVDCF